MNKEREEVLKILEQVEYKLILAARTLKRKAVFFKQDEDAMRNIEKSLSQVSIASKNLNTK